MPWAQQRSSRGKLSPLQTVPAAVLKAIGIPSAVGDPNITPNSFWRVEREREREREKARE